MKLETGQGTGHGSAQLELAPFPRDTGEPSEQVVRIVSILVHLLRSGATDAAWYQRHFERSERQFARDMQHLRKVGAELGLRIGRQRAGRVTLEAFEGRNRLGDVARMREEALRGIAWALGSPAARELAAEGDGAERGERFLLLGLPRLIDGTQAAETYEALKGAYLQHARVRFRYHDPYGRTTSRVVEPYRVLAHAGRYFLIAYDVASRRDWRYFALDRIERTPERAGTFVPRAIPPEYLACDAVGMIQRRATPLEVTVRLGPAVATSVASRQWQRAQRVSTRADGSADIVLTVSDVDEAVRWALGFGEEARIIAPDAAVAAAARTVAGLARRYGLPVAATTPARQATAAT